jgi:hypothetical protein
MTPTDPSPRARPSKIRTYRRLTAGFVIVGVAGGLALRSLGHPLFGEAVYLIGALGFLAVWLGSSVPLFDERDVALERRAGQITVALFAPVLIVGASAARVVPLVSNYSVPPELRGALYGYVALFGVFGAVYAWLRVRR